MKLLQQQLKHSDTFWLSNGLKKRPIFNDPFFNIGISFFLLFNFSHDLYFCETRSRRSVEVEAYKFGPPTDHDRHR
jgi:hypothetical protein